MNKTSLLFVLLIVSQSALATELRWDDVYYASGPYIGAQKTPWADRDESQKAGYLELHYKAIIYCLQNLNKSPAALRPEISGPQLKSFPLVTPEVISSLYREYGDYKRAAEVGYKYWVDSKHKPLLQSPEGDPIDYVIFGYKQAQMYKELAAFYAQAHKEKMKWLAGSTDVTLLKNDFNKYKQNWPSQAENYQQFMNNWAKAKKLAKTSKPKPLDPAVQHHEWFYSEKREEVLKALEYYNKHNVVFMLEKALKHKDPVMAAKAKEYLDGLGRVRNNAEKVK